VTGSTDVRGAKNSGPVVFHRRPQVAGAGRQPPHAPIGARLRPTSSGFPDIGVQRRALGPLVCDRHAILGVLKMPFPPPHPELLTEYFSFGICRKPSAADAPSC